MFGLLRRNWIICELNGYTMCISSKTHGGSMCQRALVVAIGINNVISKRNLRLLYCLSVSANAKILSSGDLWEAYM